MIVTVFGKKGSGKSVLSKNYMLSTGGRVVFLSPVEDIALAHSEIWSLSEVPAAMESMKPGDILLLRIASVDAADIVCAQAIYEPLGYTVVFDEMNQYKGSSELLDAIHYSRHFDINIIANTRRYTDMPRLITSQADELCVFASQEPRDIEYLRHFTTPEFAEKIKSLPQFHYLHYPTGAIRKAQFRSI